MPNNASITTTPPDSPTESQIKDACMVILLTVLPVTLVLEVVIIHAVISEYTSSPPSWRIEGIDNKLRKLNDAEGRVFFCKLKADFPATGASETDA